MDTASGAIAAPPYRACPSLAHPRQTPALLCHARPFEQRAQDGYVQPGCSWYSDDNVSVHQKVDAALLTGFVIALLHNIRNDDNE